MLQGRRLEVVSTVRSMFRERLLYANKNLSMKDLCNVPSETTLQHNLWYILQVLYDNLHCEFEVLLRFVDKRSMTVTKEIPPAHFNRDTIEKKNKKPDTLPSLQLIKTSFCSQIHKKSLFLFSFFMNNSFTNKDLRPPLPSFLFINLHLIKRH